MCAATALATCAERKTPVTDLGEVRASGWPQYMAWSPDSKELYFVLEEDLKLHAVDADAGPDRVLSDLQMIFPTTSADGTAVFYLDSGGKGGDNVPPLLYRAPLANGQFGPAVVAASDVTPNYVVSFDGNRVVFADYSSRLVAVDVGVGPIGTFAMALPLALSPDGLQVAAYDFSGVSQGAIVVDLMTGVRQALPTTSDHYYVIRWEGNAPRTIVDAFRVTDLLTGDYHDLPVGMVAAFGGDPFRPTHAFVWDSFCIQEETKVIENIPVTLCVVYQFQLQRVDLETYAGDVVAQAGGFSTLTAVSPDGRRLANAFPSGPDGSPTIYIKTIGTP